MLLASTTDKMSLITDRTCDVDVVVNFIDRNQSTGVVGAASRQVTGITTNSTTDILAAPGATTDRKILSVTIRNAHASTSVDITLQYNANGTLYEMVGARLYPTEMLQWNAQDGWVHNRRKTIPLYETRISSEGNTRMSNLVTGSDTNMCTVYGCQVPVPPTSVGSTTRVVCSLYLWHDLAAATTTGVAIGQIMPFPGFSSTNNQKIETCLASAGGGTGCQISSHDGGGADSLVANGTSSLTNEMGIGGGHIKYTEVALPGEPTRACHLAVQSEVAGSQVTINRGAWFQVFEETG